MQGLHFLVGFTNEATPSSHHFLILYLRESRFTEIDRLQVQALGGYSDSDQSSLPIHIHDSTRTETP